MLAALALFSPPAPAEVLPNANDLPDLPELPELTPTPGTIPLPELPSVSVPVDLYVAREVLWGSILGNDQQDAALVQALDGVRVVLSGLRKIDGKKQLYVGIDEQQFAKHNIEHIRTVLETRFPTIPIYIPLIGRVAAVPQLIGDNTANVDATFIAYPRTPTAGCALEWTDKATREKFCLDFSTDNQIERVQPLKIRGKGEEVYTVVGAQEPVEGLRVWMSGALSRKVEGRDTLEGTISSYGKLLASSYLGNSFNYLAEMDEHESIGGDSGGPVYTAPDTNGRVRILGVLSGSGAGFVSFSPWYDVEKAYNLKPIQ